METMLIHATTWLNLKCILLSKRRKTQKASYCVIPLILQNEKQNYSDRKHMNSCPRAWERGEMTESKGIHSGILW